MSPHFLPDFLMPCDPVFSGPLPPAFFASSSFAFLSVPLDISVASFHMIAEQIGVRTSLLLRLDYDLSAGKSFKESANIQASSSSSNSFFTFLGALLWMGLAGAGD